MNKYSESRVPMHTDIHEVLYTRCFEIFIHVYHDERGHFRISDLVITEEISILVDMSYHSKSNGILIMWWDDSRVTTESSVSTARNLSGANTEIVFAEPSSQTLFFHICTISIWIVFHVKHFRWSDDGSQVGSHFATWNWSIIRIYQHWSKWSQYHS